MKNKNKKVLIFYRSDNKQAYLWASKIKRWIKKYYPEIKITESKPNIVIALGGDGSMLEASKLYGNSEVLIIGLNLGKVGFLTSVRKTRDFFPQLKKFFEGDYSIVERMMLEVNLIRKGKIIFSADILNDVVIQNPLGVVEIEVFVGNHPIQYIRGSGVLVSTATGSTAFNLSAHGPIVMPDIQCMIVTELLDHDIPTPSIVIKPNQTIRIKIIHFREHGALINANSKEPADVLLSCDGEKAISLKKGDEIKIEKSPRTVKFVELEKNYFFRSIKEKFFFK
jgi:NAD+ kinase